MAWFGKTKKATSTFNLETGRYDPGKQADMTRSHIGYALLGLLIGIVLFGYIALFLIQQEAKSGQNAVLAALQSKEAVDRASAILKIQVDQAQADGDRLTAFLNIVFGPVVALLGSVTGFYFGTQSRTPPGDPAGGNNSSSDGGDDPGLDLDQGKETLPKLVPGDPANMPEAAAGAAGQTG